MICLDAIRPRQIILKLHRRRWASLGVFQYPQLWYWCRSKCLSSIPTPIVSFPHRLDCNYLDASSKSLKDAFGFCFNFDHHRPSSQTSTIWFFYHWFAIHFIDSIMIIFNWLALSQLKLLNGWYCVDPQKLLDWIGLDRIGWGSQVDCGRNFKCNDAIDVSSAVSFHWVLRELGRSYSFGQFPSISIKWHRWFHGWSSCSETALKLLWNCTGSLIVQSHWFFQSQSFGSNWNCSEFLSSLCFWATALELLWNCTGRPSNSLFNSSGSLTSVKLISKWNWSEFQAIWGLVNRSETALKLPWTLW